MKEKKARVEDALNATRAAVEEGIVPGGGVALLRAAKALDNLKLAGDEATGADIVRRALEEPIRRIVENAGLEGSVVVEKVKAAKDAGHGFDAERNEYVDMMHGRDHRPDQGGADRAAERRLDRVAAPDDRGADHGHSGERRRPCRPCRMVAAWGAWAAATSNPPARASGDSDGLRGHPASGGRLPSMPIAVC